jgi:hypothetical protein
MTENDFRRMALGLDGAVEGAHMGHPDFRAHGRIFATLRGDGAHAMVKLTPEQQERYVNNQSGFVPESGAWGRQGCTRVVLDSVDAEALGETLTLAWQNVARKNPKSQIPLLDSRSGWPEQRRRPKPKSQRAKPR